MFSSSLLGKFTIPEPFPVEQLYDIYMQKHALDDLAFAMEFKVESKEEFQREDGRTVCLEYSEF